MKLSFKNISIRYKLLFIIVMVSVVALLTASAFTLYFQRSMYLERVKYNLSIQARIIASNNTAALNFNDTLAAMSILHTVGVDSAIRHISLYNPRYSPFARFSRDSILPDIKMIQGMSPGIATVKNNEIHLIVNVQDEESSGEVIGYLYIKRGLQDFDVFIRQFVWTTVIILLAVLVFTIIMALVMQKIVSKPIVRLAQLTHTITQTRNYKTSLPYQADDETGKLVSGFNEMLKTIDVQNEELVSAREEAIRNAQVKQEFLANMSHEIRTPLNVIVGLSNILIDTNINDEQRKYLKNIKTASDNVLLIVNDILDYSRISSEKVEFERIEFPVTSVASEVIESLREKAREKGLELKLFTGPGIPSKVLGDRLKLYQILINLVSNALKFTNQGYIHIFIEVLQQSDITCNLAFRVRDTGIGIPPEKQNLVFESFRQASPESSRKYGGTGLGLAIAKQLVELQGGKIELESKPGQGTTFNFNIIYNKPAATSIPATEEKETIPIVYDLLKTASILIIEDNPMNIMVMQALLKKAGVTHLHTAVNETEAKEKLVSNTFNVVLIDIYMENTNGFELTRFIREEITGPKRNTPVIAVTGAFTEDDHEKCISSGMNDFITKPFNPNDMYSKIIKHLKQNK